MNHNSTLKILYLLNKVHDIVILAHRKTGWHIFVKLSCLVYELHNKIFKEGFARLRREDWAMKITEPTKDEIEVE